MDLSAFRLDPVGDDPFGWFEATCQCGACNGLQSFGDVLDIADDMVTLSAAKTIFRAEAVGIDLDPSQKDKDPSDDADAENASYNQEDGTDDFDAEELALAALLLAAMVPRYKPFLIAFLQVLDAQPFSERDALQVIADHQKDMGSIFDPVESDATKIIDRVMTRGEAKVANVSVQNSINKDVVQKGIVRATKYYTNNFFNSQIVPAIQKQMAAVLADPATQLNSPDFSALKAMLDKRLKTVPYWRVVANAAASRGFHYGYLKALSITGVTGYRLVAVIDDRTSKICRHLNGMTFWVKDALDVMERMSADDDPTAAKRYMPWQRADAVEGKTRTQLKEMGVLVPPLHASCRSSIRPVKGTPLIL